MRSRVLRRTAPVAVLLVLAVGCGSDDSASDADDQDRAGQADESAGTIGGSDGDGTVEDSDAAAQPASIDPASMPPAGEAVAQIGGNTFRYTQADSIESAFSCEFGDQLLANFQSDGDDLLIQVNPFDGGWAGSVVVTSRDVEEIYQGAGTYPAEAFAVEGPYLVFTGDFTSYTQADPANQSPAGQGRIEVTCP
jgi:hypothetical protein